MYKPEQGKWTRGGSFVGILALVIWGSYFLHQRLTVYDGDDWWRLLIVYGIPLVWMAGLAAVAWWVTYSRRSTSDFMIATEGEMKKVSWSSRREIIGSTKVVIVITLLMSTFLFLIDILFQYLFRSIGVLKV